MKRNPVFRSSAHALRGFTLLEALVGITIFSLVIVILYTGYRLGMRSWESGERTHAAVSELRLAGSFIRRHAAQAFPLAISEKNAWRMWFHGEPHRLVFVTAMPAYLGQGGMYEMTLELDEREDGAALMVSRRLLHPDSEPGRPGVEDQPRPLVEDLNGARFAFYGAQAKDLPRAWHDRWDARQRLPDLVRLRLDSKTAGEWPELVIRLPADAVRYQRSVAPGSPGQQTLQGRLLPADSSILAPGLVQ
jgi:general secretion pathway protein J